ncbi:MAG: thiamine biosynthesis protein ThiS [Rickettsiales bacterium]|nr:thiamine biosynthesis protein ThiS [Rickettsiales bacterium]|tara:strand:+ start:247 stop:444 length:198 start_codon:yes stop_codon:yes gene_type:complete
MQVTINGESRSVTASTLQQLTDELEIDLRKVAIEHNMVIIPRGQYDATMLKEGDTLEIVEFIGGG